jgi:hypothetical protein
MKRTLLIKVDFGNGLIAFQFKTKVQVKGLAHMFCLKNSSHKLYKEHVFI